MKNILNTFSLECNRQTKINFEGGDLSSDAGLLMLKEFAEKIGFVDLLKKHFKTKDPSTFRIHGDVDNLLQVIYSCIAAYHEDDCADELTLDPIFTSILEKDALASQPTLSRFFNRMDEDVIKQLETITQESRQNAYRIERPEHLLIDIDSSLLPTFGEQEGEAFNYHYQAHGYHPLFAFDGITGDLLKAELREGTHYCSRDAHKFVEPLLLEFEQDYYDIPVYLRGDSGFASPDLYEMCEEHNCKYAIRLKQNKSLMKNIQLEDAAFTLACNRDIISHKVTYGEFIYQAGSWKVPRRVVYKIEKPYGQCHHLYTFIVTNMEMDPYQVIQFYCGRGRMENFIKEGKSGFDFAATSSHSMVVNACRFLIRCLAYNLFNWFRRLVLPKSMCKQRIDTIRLKLLKIAARVVKGARYITFKLCSSCPYKDEFYETFENIRRLQLQIE